MAITIASGSPALLVFLRFAALAISLGTLAFLFVSGDWRADNAFLIPDLVLCAALVTAALTPRRRAIPALLLSFGFAAGVLGSAAMSYVVEGRFGPGATAGFLGSVAAAALLLRIAWTAPTAGKLAPRALCGRAVAPDPAYWQL